MTADWCSLITDGELSGNGCLDSVLNTVRYRVKNCTGMELFYVCIFLLAVHSYACIVYRFFERYHYDTHTEDYLRGLQVQRPVQVVCTPPQEDTCRQVTVESPPLPVSTSTAQSTAEGLCQGEDSSSDSEKEKPIWRPKLKRKRKKNNRQGW